ncbi:MAG: phosphotransferase [Bacteroidales bacterium]|nr:phosphotransferase [Bacteroidales bacterium]
MKTSDIDDFILLFEKRFIEQIDSFELLSPSGSYREYCRMQNYGRSVICALNSDVKENEAFFSFTEHFRNQNIPVPEIYVISSDKKKYILEDLGDTTLFDFICKIRGQEDFSERIITEYKKVLKLLPKIQIIAGKDLDYSVCYPCATFDRQSIMWDLNYFKYYSLKLARVSFDEQALENDFNELSNYLTGAGCDYFMFRDFQSRNIMLKNGMVYFIDYQGGRHGALQYDLVSLLYDSKADIPENVRKELFDFYLKELQEYLPVNKEEFSAYFRGFAIIRIMQAMGAYGFRGWYEKKEHFLKSIPYALKNLKLLLDHLDLPINLPELTRVLRALTESEVLMNIGSGNSLLTVHLSSFSYKKGIPYDQSGNGGGFVFDCRALNNPGRYDEYKNLTGKDFEIQKFIEENSEIDIFMNSVKTLVGQSINIYLERGFSDLSINFGCTGGKHRSVYSAEKLAEYLKEKFPVNVVLTHNELEH